MSPEEVSEVPLQLPRPPLRPGRLQQLRESLSLRLGSLDPDWLRRCHQGTLGFPGASEVCPPVLGTKEPQPPTSGVPSVLGPSTVLEVPLQSPEAPGLQAAEVGAVSPSPGSSQGKKQRQSGEPEMPPAWAEQHSSQVGPPSEGAGAAVQVKHGPGEPVRAQPLSSPSTPRYYSLPSRVAFSWARVRRAVGRAQLCVPSRPAVQDRGNYVRLNMKQKRYVRGLALRGRLLRKQVR